MTTYSIKLFENPNSKEKTNGMKYHTMSKAAAIADKLFNTGLYYEVQVINNDNGQAWYTQKNQRPEPKENQTMNENTIQDITGDIDNALVTMTIEQYKKDFSEGDKQPRREMAFAICGYAQALEDLGLINGEDFIRITKYVETV